jgi:hypothetical protein
LYSLWDVHATQTLRGRVTQHRYQQNHHLTIPSPSEKWLQHIYSLATIRRHIQSTLRDALTEEYLAQGLNGWDIGATLSSNTSLTALPQVPRTLSRNGDTSSNCRHCLPTTCYKPKLSSWGKFSLKAKPLEETQGEPAKNETKQHILPYLASQE